MIRPYRITADPKFRPFQVFIGIDIMDVSHLHINKTNASPPGFWELLGGTDTYNDFVRLLREKKLPVVLPPDYRALNSRYSGVHSYYQEFTLDGVHYGSILAPCVYFSGDVEEIGAAAYYSALIRYVESTGEVPGYHS